MKKFKKINIFMFFVLFYSFNSKAYSEYWPSLYEPRDFISVSEKEFEKEKIDIHKLTPEMIQKKLYQSFHFFSDFVSETNTERPVGWVDPVLDPQKALEIGYPAYMKRPEADIYFPIYPLKKLAYFKGDSVVNAEINVCQTFWLQNLNQETYNCFSSLQYNIMRGAYKAPPLVKMQVTLLQGFFMLQLLLNHEKNIKNITFNTIPASYFRFKSDEILNITKAIFYYVATHYDENLLIPKTKSNDILEIYPQLFKNPHYYKKLNKKKGFVEFKNDFVDFELNSSTKYSVELNNEPIELLTWIHTMLPVIYMNVITLYQKQNEYKKVFEMGKKLDNYFQFISFPEQIHESAIKNPSLANVTQEIYLKPMNNNDLSITVNLYKAIILQKLKQPEAALKLISQGILKKGDPDLTSLLFKVSGDAYYDLNILKLARRSYSWSEMYSKNFVDKVPAVLFFGAESAFWLGQYDIAKSGFKRFLLACGDTKYGPLATLRLGSIEQLQGNMTNANSIYSTILRNLNLNSVAQEASVNLFCMNMNQMTPRVKKLEYQNVVKKIKDTRFDLQRQAKACLLNSDLVDATIQSVTDTSKNVVEKANFQKEIINKYNKEFPDNEFIVLFADRIKQLSLSSAAFFASQNKCNNLINFYEKNRKDLIQLTKYNDKYVKGLKWSAIERKKLLRCAVFVNNDKLWKEARKFDVAQDGGELHNKLYKLTFYPSAQRAIDLYSSLKDSADQWNLKLKQVENSTNELTAKNDFWELLSLKKFLNYELTADKATKRLLSNAIVNDIMKKPKLIFELPLFCSWFLNAFDKLSSADLDVVTNMHASASWVSILDNSVKVDSCQKTVAENLLNQSMKNPSEIRDKIILLPYLKKLGVGQVPEDWLAYAQRLESQKGFDDNEVVDIYKDLSKNSKNILVKSMASMWLKKNFPNSADKMLW